MSDQLIPLTLPVVDALAFAAVRGCLQTTLAESRNVYAADELGPLVEFLHAVRADDTISSTDLVRLVTATGSLGEVLSGLVFGRPGCLAADGRLAGFYRTGSDAEGEEDEWISFLMAARRATTVAQFPAREGAQIVAAMRELRSNIDEHSGAPGSGIVAFKAGIPGHFEFVVADQGRGVLDSLRSSQEYAGLNSHARALRLALEEGESRKGRGIGNGNGFRPIFAGLADMRGRLRFRSGDHALVIDGRFDLTTAAIAQKAMLPGFIAMVSCRA